MIKTLIYQDAEAPKRSDEGSGAKAAAAPRPPRVVVALVRGDHEINEIKLGKLAGMKLELAPPAVIERVTGAKVGFAGPQGLADRVDLLLIDRDAAAMTSAASGANKTDYHVRNLTPGRDFPLSGDKARVADIRSVVDGDLAAHGSPIRLRKAIEVGHIFKLGAKYSQAMNATFLNAQGKPEPFIMGCYGIGLNRIVAAAIEGSHDENGVIWPMTIAPFEALVIALDPRDEAVMQTATMLHDRLAEAGVDVLLDDRDERAGFKFKDADLIGIPLRITVGKKSLAEGHVELSWRRDGVKHPHAPAAALQQAIDGVRQARQALQPA
jgi:prolyl-tRNA synthetase